MSIENLSLKLLNLDTISFDLGRQTLDLDALEDNHKGQIVAKIEFLVIGKVLNPRLSKLVVVDITRKLGADE